MTTHSPSTAGKPTVAVGTLVWRTGVASRLTVVVEATFGFVHGGFARLVTPRPFGPESLAPQLPGAGIVLTGHACAPSGRPATNVVVRLGIVRDRPVLDKTIHVLGDRASLHGEPQPFERIPLTWERALGGPGHPLNQAGSGCPNLIDPSDPLRPAGFGAVRREAPERLRWLGRVPLANVSLAEVPPGVDLRFFHAAPRDQQLDALHGDEWVILDGMHPALPRIWTKLPAPQPSARWLPVGGAPFPVALALNTLTIDADHLLATLTWRGTIALDDPNTRGRADASLVLSATGAAPVAARVTTPAAKTIAPKVGRETLALEADTVRQLVTPFPIAAASRAPTEPPSVPRTRADKTSTIDELDIATMVPEGRPIQASFAPFPVAPPRSGAEPQRLPLPGAPWSAPPQAPPAPTHGVEPSPPPGRAQKTWTSDLGKPVPRPLAPFSLAEPSAAPLHAVPVKAVPLPGAPWSHAPAARIPVDDDPGSTTITLGDGDGDRIAAIFALADGKPSPRAAEEPSQARPEKLPTPPPPPLVTAPPKEPVRASIGMTLGAGILGPKSGSALSGGVGVSPIVESVPKPAPVVMKEPPPEAEVEAPRPLRVLGAVLGARPSDSAVSPPAPTEPAAASIPVPSVVEPPPVPPAPRVAVTVRDKVIAALAAGELVRGMDLTKADLHDIDFTKAALGGCRLAGADLSGCILREARLDDADLAGARLSNADLTSADLSRADLSRAHGDGAKLDGAKGSRARFVGGSWDGASFVGFEATAADFTGASLVNARFEGATLLEANLEGAHGGDVVFDRARLPGARFESATFPRGSFASIDAPDSRWDRAILEDAHFEGAVLSRASFERATCPRASFRAARLDRATLTHMVAEEAVLDEAILEGSDMRASRLGGASLEKARLGGVVAPRVDLARAKLEGADLKGANFRTAKLPDANLRGACLDAADLRDADLTRSDLTGASRAGTKMQGAKLKDAKGATDG